jgi:EAL domain-containing protein (putative c-di-GMP-specific phosphodiesterase class I)
MRWRDPERGLVPPGQFIPLMEEIGLIRQAGAWALHQAVTDMERWRAMGLQVPRCAVNVSAVQLRSKDFVDTVLHAIGEFGDQACQLDIEITESLLMQDEVQTSRVLQTLQGLGVHVSVDDFGTGYSSLAYLARLPINALKIDRAFIMEMEQGEQGVTIVGSIISLAHALRLVVIAEGVETEAQASILRGLKCDLMQGYLFSRPLPFDAMADMLPRAAPAQTVAPSA